jgi:hypothetical protein
MARGTPKKAGARAATARRQGSDLQVTVPVPQGYSISVKDLKTLDEKALNELLDQAKKAQVGFIILNAPFKVRPVEPVS